MLNTFPNTNMNTFDETSFIGGTYKKLVFFVTVSSSVVSLDGFTGIWTLAPFQNQDYAVLTITSPLTRNKFVVELSSEQTENLSGKYIQEARVSILPSYTEYGIGRGVVNIIPRIGLEYHEQQ